MPSKKVVDSWKFPAGYEVDEENQVTLIWCKVCREYFNELAKASEGHVTVGVAETGAKTFVKGTNVVKKTTVLSI